MDALFGDEDPFLMEFINMPAGEIAAAEELVAVPVEEVLTAVGGVFVTAEDLDNIVLESIVAPDALFKVRTATDQYLVRNGLATWVSPSTYNGLEETSGGATKKKKSRRAPSATPLARSAKATADNLAPTVTADSILRGELERERRMYELAVQMNSMSSSSTSYGGAPPAKKVIRRVTTSLTLADFLRWLKMRRDSIGLRPLYATYAAERQSNRFDPKLAYYEDKNTESADIRASLSLAMDSHIAIIEAFVTSCATGGLMMEEDPHNAFKALAVAQNSLRRSVGLCGPLQSKVPRLDAVEFKCGISP